MGLKSTNEGKTTTVYLPPDVRAALATKEWTILTAIKNGLNYTAVVNRESAIKEGEYCQESDCIRAKNRLIHLALNYPDIYTKITEEIKQ